MTSRVSDTAPLAMEPFVTAVIHDIRSGGPTGLMPGLQVTPTYVANEKHASIDMTINTYDVHLIHFLMPNVRAYNKSSGSLAE